MIIHWLFASKYQWIALQKFSVRAHVYTYEDETVVIGIACLINGRICQTFLFSDTPAQLFKRKPRTFDDDDEWSTTIFVQRRRSTNRCNPQMGRDDRNWLGNAYLPEKDWSEREREIIREIRQNVIYEGFLPVVRGSCSRMSRPFTQFLDVFFSFFHFDMSVKTQIFLLRRFFFLSSEQISGTQVYLIRCRRSHMSEKKTAN